MTPPFVEVARQGLESARSGRLRFWKREALQLADAEACLGNLDRLEKRQDQVVVLSLARAAAPPQATPSSRLAVLRRALEALSNGTTYSLTGLAGLSLALRERSDPACRAAVEQALAGALPVHPALRASAPNPGWLLDAANFPEPRTGAEWCETLEGLASRPALEHLGSAHETEFLRALDRMDLGPADRTRLERDSLLRLGGSSTTSQCAARALQLSELEPRTVEQLGAYLLEQSGKSRLGSLFGALEQPPFEVAGKLLLEAPDFTLGEAARRLAGRVPERELVAALLCVEPDSSNLALLSRVSNLPALKTGLEKLDLARSADLLSSLEPHLEPSETRKLARELASPGQGRFQDQVQNLPLSASAAASLAVASLATEDDMPVANRAASLLGRIKLAPEDVVVLGEWMLSHSTEQPVTRMARAAEALPLPDRARVLRAAAAQLDQPFSFSCAVDHLTELGPREALGVLTAAAPGPALTTLAHVANPEAVRVGLQHLHEGPVALLERLSPLLPPAEVLALVETDEPLLEAVRRQAWSCPQHQVAAVLAGCRALEQAPVVPGQRAARVALEMSRATNDINEKLFLARAGLKASGHPAAETLLQLTRLDGPNATWSQAALALGGLRTLTVAGAEGLRPVVETVQRASQTWAGPAWREALLEGLRSSPGRLGAMTRATRSMEDLALLLDDPVLAMTTEAPAPAAIQETPTHLVVAGVRLGKRSPGRSTGGELVPLAPPPPAAAALELGPAPEPGEAVQVLRDTSFMNGLALVYNPVSGVIERQTSYKNGVGGVFNPQTGAIEWKTSYLNGVAGVYNPTGREVEWQTRYMNGVAGAYRCETGTVEWRMSYKNGIAGLYDPARREIRWEQSYKNGVGLATNDPEYPVLALGPGFHPPTS